MCGRFTLKQPSAAADVLGLSEVPELAPRYNIAPTQSVAAVRSQPGGGRRLDMLRWGLVPPWVKDVKQAPMLVNARVETVMEKPSFRGAFRARRCLIPADGFYEWKTVGGKKQPMYFTMRDGASFALAGLWERWEGPRGAHLESFTLLTTEPNAVVADVHDRMPVILPPDAYALWLDPTITDSERLLPFLGPSPAEAMRVYPVSPRVNSAASDDPSLVEPVSELPPPPQELRLF